MGAWKTIILSMFQFFLAVQFIFMVSCLTWNRHPEYEKKEITYFIIKAIQYFIHIVFYPNLENYEKYLKYHTFLYFIMDIYGLILIDTRTVSFWIILAQLFIGLTVTSLITIYNSLFTIQSYLLNLFTFKQTIQYNSIFENYLIAQFFIAVISFNLFRFYDYTICDIYYLFCRLTQYFISYYKIQTKSTEFSMIFLLVIDMLMNILGLLYLNRQSVMFWIIFIQIVLGCFHYCLILLSLALYTISKYYLCVCSYVQFRLNKLSQNDNEDSLYTRFIEIFVKIYFVVQITFAIISIIKLRIFGFTLIELIYIILRFIQYSFHSFNYLRNQGFTVYFNYHFTFYFLMDIFGLFLLSFQIKIFWSIVLQIFLGFIIYYWLLIECFSSINLEQTFSKKIINTPFENLILCYLLLEIGLSILQLQFNGEAVTFYLIIRILQYGIILLSCIFVEQLQLKFLYGIMIYFLFIQCLWGFSLLITQSYAIRIIFSQIVLDIIIAGSFFHSTFSLCYYIVSRRRSQNFLQIWVENQEDLIELYKYEMPNLLWCFNSTEIQNQFENKQNICVICLAPLDNGLQKNKLLCHNSHEFHQYCLQQWRQYKSTCPICRTQISNQMPIVLVYEYNSRYSFDSNDQNY